MAKENGAPTAAEKGKAKEGTSSKEPIDGKDASKKAQDGKLLPNGDKKGEEGEEGWSWGADVRNAFG